MYTIKPEEVIVGCLIALPLGYSLQYFAGKMILSRVENMHGKVVAIKTAGDFVRSTDGPIRRVFHLGGRHAADNYLPK